MEESSPTPTLSQFRHRLGLLGAATLCTLGIVACGSGERQDVNEPEGDFPVEVVSAEFPNRQRLAETSDLVLEVRNTGEEAIPNLAITVFTDPNADGSFSAVSQQDDLAIPSRPVWILEEGYPKLVGETETAGAESSLTNTFTFGELPAGQSKAIVWQVTPVQSGNFTVSYRVAAGLYGKAVAVTDDGSVPEGEFAVEITNVPPQTRVDDSGKVVPIGKNDLIGKAGSDKQRSEVGQGAGPDSGNAGK